MQFPNELTQCINQLNQLKTVLMDKQQLEDEQKATAQLEQLIHVIQGVVAYLQQAETIRRHKREYGRLHSSLCISEPPLWWDYFTQRFDQAAFMELSLSERNEILLDRDLLVSILRLENILNHQRLNDVIQADYKALQWSSVYNLSNDLIVSVSVLIAIKLLQLSGYFLLNLTALGWIGIVLPILFIPPECAAVSTGYLSFIGLSVLATLLPVTSLAIVSIVVVSVIDLYLTYCQQFAASQLAPEVGDLQEKSNTLTALKSNLHFFKPNNQSLLEEVKDEVWFNSLT